MTPINDPNKSANGIKTVFLIGHPRSGTTWLMWLLAQHPAVVSCNHAGFFHALQPLRTWWTQRTPFAKNIHVFRRTAESQVEAEYTKINLAEQLDEAQFTALARPLTESVFQAIAAAKPGAAVAVEQTPENALFFDWLHPILPDAYFLHIYRDPRAVAASMRQALRDWADPNDFPNHPVQIARSWNRYMDLGKHIQERTDRYLAISYEDLRSRGASALQGIFEWLDLDTSVEACARYLEASTIDKMKQKNRMPRGFFRRGQSGGWEQDLKASQIRMVEYISAPWMEVLGYERRFPRLAAAPFPVRWYEFISGFQSQRGGLRGRLRRFMDRSPVLRPLLRWSLSLRRTLRGMSE